MSIADNTNPRHSSTGALDRDNYKRPVVPGPNEAGLCRMRLDLHSAKPLAVATFVPAQGLEAEHLYVV